MNFKKIFGGFAFAMVLGFGISNASAQQPMVTANGGQGGHAEVQGNANGGIATASVPVVNAGDGGSATAIGYNATGPSNTRANGGDGGQGGLFANAQGGGFVSLTGGQVTGGNGGLATATGDIDAGSKTTAEGGDGGTAVASASTKGSTSTATTTAVGLHGGSGGPAVGTFIW